MVQDQEEQPHHRRRASQASSCPFTVSLCFHAHSLPLPVFSFLKSFSVFSCRTQRRVDSQPFPQEPDQPVERKDGAAVACVFAFCSRTFAVRSVAVLRLLRRLISQPGTPQPQHHVHSAVATQFAFNTRGIHHVMREENCLPEIARRAAPLISDTSASHPSRFYRRRCCFCHADTSPACSLPLQRVV